MTINSLATLLVQSWTSQLFHSATAAAKSLQSSLTLCDPIPGILQARTLEWAAISFSSAWKWKVKVKLLSHVWLFATPWTVAYRLLRPWDFPGQRTGVGCHCTQGVLTVAFWPTYRFLKRQVRWSVIPISLISLPQFVTIHTVKGLSEVSETEVNVFSGIPLLSLWSSKFWQFDLWFLCLF